MKHLRKLLRDLCSSGVLARISLTPTDILHVTGEYVKWNSDIAKTYVDIYASQCGLTPADFINKVEAMIIQKLDCACIQASMYFDHQQIDMEEGGAADYFLNKLFFDDDSGMLGTEYYLKQKVVAIGAPARAWASRSGKCLHADVIVPENAEVANALGAAVGRMIEEIEILIRPNNLNGGFIVYSPTSRKCFKTLTEATECAEEAGRNCVHRFAGSERCSLSTKIEDVNIEGADRNEKVFVERIVTVFMDFSKIN
jgi:N-methylhydantoinase A/oxoprolinase/acetone carboxylase beta subunit